MFVICYHNEDNKTVDGNIVYGPYADASEVRAALERFRDKLGANYGTNSSEIVLSAEVYAWIARIRPDSDF